MYYMYIYDEGEVGIFNKNKKIAVEVSWTRLMEYELDSNIVNSVFGFRLKMLEKTYEYSDQSCIIES